MNPASRRIATAAPGMKPRASMAATSVVPLPFQWADMRSMTSRNVLRSASNGVMSRNRIPGCGKSGTSRTIRLRSSARLMRTSYHCSEVFEGSPQAVLEVDARLPTQKCARPRDVGPALPGVIDGKVAMLDGALRAGDPDDRLRQLDHRHLVRVAEVGGELVAFLEHRHHAADQIRHVAEAARLAAVSVNG